MRTLRLTIAYDGSEYAGWQVQPGRSTIQGALEGAVERVTGQAARTLASGRTDAGVHALGQVVSLRTDSTLTPDVLVRALNANLPDDIAVLAVAVVPSSFHPIRDVVRKRYRYVLYDSPVRDVFRRCYCWHYTHGRLDAEAMQRAANSLLGTHDFSSFESSGAERKTSVRTVFDLVVERGRGGDKTSERCDDLLVIEVEADGFLYNMVRAMVGTLVQVGNGSRSEGWPGEVLQQCDRRFAGPTAPPQGLFLLRVEYGSPNAER
jgi:tRNA pseudouridine38-40 synthase